MRHADAIVLVAFPTAIICTVLRYLVTLLANAVWRVPSPRHDDKQRHASKRVALVEETWLFFSSIVLLTLSIWISENHNDKCSLFDQSGCFEDWPHQQQSAQASAALALFLGWYCHCIFKSLVPGIGVHSGLDMMGHHFLTLALIGAAHAFNVQRIGLLVLALVNFSSPLMHVAKIMHNSKQSLAVRAGTFLLFAAAFALSRCILFPRLTWNLARTGLSQPNVAQDRIFETAVVCLSGMVLLQGLQFYWMWRIIRVILRGGMEPHQSTTSTPSTPQPAALDSSAPPPQPQPADAPSATVKPLKSVPVTVRCSLDAADTPATPDPVSAGTNNNGTNRACLLEQSTPSTSVPSSPGRPAPLDSDMASSAPSVDTVATGDVGLGAMGAVGVIETFAPVIGERPSTATLRARGPAAQGGAAVAAAASLSGMHGELMRENVDLSNAKVDLEGEDVKRVWVSWNS